MKVHGTEFEGVKVLELAKFQDFRGSFVKTFNDSLFADCGINMNVKESYYSVSNKNVIRGMHFQLPPFDHDKLVHVINGDIVDVLVDLRKNSQTYLKCTDFYLSGDEPKALFIPRGIAHGFKTLEDHSIMIYWVSTGYHQIYDSGIRYDSIGYDWGIQNAIVSSRDRELPKLQRFMSPF